MKENEEQQHVDWLRNLPEGLLFEILLKLPTKDVVKCSVLSSWWRNIWKLVPGLDLDSDDFREHNDLASFVERFLGFNSESSLLHFKIRCGLEEDDCVDIAQLTRWLSTVIERKVQHLHFWYTTWRDFDLELEIPQTVYTCESLVSLKLCGNTLVSLPLVKEIVLDSVLLTDYSDFGLLISGCPLVKSLTLYEFEFSIYPYDPSRDYVVAIDAPRLEYLKLSDHYAQSIIIHSPGSLVEADIDITFNLDNINRLDPDNLPMTNMIRNFLTGLSSVKVMEIHPFFLEAIYNYSRCQRLPLFPNLSSLRVEFIYYMWEMLPIFLETCPNLKHLSLVFYFCPEEEISYVPEPQCFLPSLEFVEIRDGTDSQEIDEARETKLVSYFLEKSTILKKLTLNLNPDRKKKASVILKKFLTIPTLSPSCQVVVL